MEDRELFELAAKAAGLGGSFCRKKSRHAYWYKTSLRGLAEFNPLTNDGDALRLANELGLHIDFHGCMDSAPQVTVEHWSGKVVMPRFPDSMAQVRRAIVTAAAEVGKDLAYARG